MKYHRPFKIHSTKLEARNDVAYARMFITREIHAFARPISFYFAFFYFNVTRTVFLIKIRYVLNLK